MKPVLISGIQPTGRLHIGNYLGALSNFVELQNSQQYQTLFFIADLHSLTIDFDPREKSGQIFDLLDIYLKAGLNPKQSIIFLQSMVPAHAELSWILSTTTPFGDLRRMTQFKEKGQANPQNVNVGLFFYPVLMAADVLLYDAQVVPVGDDQLQHLELARTLARKFNRRFGKVFTEPKPILTKTSRLLSLIDPNRKMSKSQPKGCLFLSDSPKEIRQKILSAVTDSGKEIRYDLKAKKAVSNLILIYAQFSRKSVKEVEAEFKGKGYADFKRALANLLIDKLAAFRQPKMPKEKLVKVLNNGAKKANEIANKKMELVKRRIGISIE